MKRVMTFCLSLLFLATTMNAQDSLLIEKLKSNLYPIQLKDGQLSGKGLEFLEQVAQESPFFLIGENHGMAEIPQFTAALFERFKPHGYRYFATETGPYTAEYLQEVAGSKDMYEQLAAFFKAYRWSIPFYSWKEECAVLETVMQGQSSAKEPIIWGLDQEFAASFRMNFKRLVKEAKSENARKIAQKYYDQTIALFEEFVQTGSPAKSFMANVRPDDFAKLKTAFAEQPDQVQMIQELEESIQIYQLWSTGGGYESNRLRAEMMKRHFRDYYTAAQKRESNPKVMVKLGANHVYRGRNGLNVMDIGNFVSELASQMETSSFHLYVLGRKGTQNAYTPFSKSESDKKKAHDATQYLDKINFTTVLEASPETEWSILDVRPLRKALFNRRLKIKDSALEKLIWTYDAILVISEVNASTYFND